MSSFFHCFRRVESWSSLGHQSTDSFTNVADKKESVSCAKVVTEKERFLSILNRCCVVKEATIFSRISPQVFTQSEGVTLSYENILYNLKFCHLKDFVPSQTYPKDRMPLQAYPLSSVLAKTTYSVEAIAFRVYSVSTMTLGHMFLLKSGLGMTCIFSSPHIDDVRKVQDVGAQILLLIQNGMVSSRRTYLERPLNEKEGLFMLEMCDLLPLGIKRPVCQPSSFFFKRCCSEEYLLGFAEIGFENICGSSGVTIAFKGISYNFQTSLLFNFDYSVHYPQFKEYINNHSSTPAVVYCIHSKRGLNIGHFFRLPIVLRSIVGCILDVELGEEDRSFSSFIRLASNGDICNEKTPVLYDILKKGKIVNTQIAFEREIFEREQKLLSQYNFSIATSIS